MAKTFRTKYAPPVQGGPTQAVNRSGGEWCGIFNAQSTANNFQVVSCALYTSSDAIQLTTKCLGTETVDFGGYVVCSLNSGVNFVIGPCASRAALVTSYQVYWQVTKLV